MLLHLIRDIATDKSTGGVLLADGQFICYTIEDIQRPIDQKVAGKTAIPRGRYKIEITRSQRFGRDLPLLIDVPNFAGVRIHPGNTAADTEGCILPGMRRGQDAVFESRRAFNTLFAMMQAAAARKESIEIVISVLKA